MAEDADVRVFDDLAESTQHLDEKPLCHAIGSRRTLNTAHDFDLPHIDVVSDPSSDKISVTEAITGLKLPTHLRDGLEREILRPIRSYQNVAL